MNRPSHLREPRARRWSVETLEPRRLLSGETAPWAAGAHLTLSFAPDGTEIAGQSSALEQHLAGLGPASQWRETILQAFQAWAETANIDFGLVADGGQAFGVAGRSQRDPRFGDVRIGAIALASDVLAIGVPQNEAVTGAWGGDVLFNTSAPLQTLGDLFSIALHEAGHVLGLEHSDDPSSPMFFHGVSASLAPTANDVALLELLYGSRQPDAYEPTKVNETLEFLDPMVDVAHLLEMPEPLGSVEGSVPSVLFADLTTAADIDWYRFQPPEEYTGPATIRVRTSGVSQVVAQLRVYDEQGALLADSASGGPNTVDPLLQLANVDSHQDYYVRVTANEDQPFRVGGYSLAVSFDQRVAVDPAAVERLMNGDLAYLSEDDLENLLARGAEALLAPDAGANDQPGDEEILEPVPGFGQLNRFETVGSLASPTDRDRYRVELPSGGAGARSLRVHLEAVDADALVALPELQNLQGQVLPATLLVRNAREITLELPDAAAGEDVVIVVSANPRLADAAGNYRLTAVAGLPVAARQTILSGQFSSASQQTAGLEVHRSQLFQFAQHVAPRASQAGPLLTEVLDAAGHVLSAFETLPGESWSPPSLLLLPGHYVLRVSAPAGGAGQEFRLEVWAASGPLGTLPQDPTGDPSDPCPDYPGVVCMFTGEFWIYQLLSADFDADGDVDLDDFATLKNNFAAGSTFAEGDADGNGYVDLGDFAALKQRFGQRTLPQ